MSAKRHFLASVSHVEISIGFARKSKKDHQSELFHEEIVIVELKVKKNPSLAYSLFSFIRVVYRYLTAPKDTCIFIMKHV